VGTSPVELEVMVEMVAHHISARPTVWPGKAFSAQRGNPRKGKELQGQRPMGREPRGNVCMRKSLSRNKKVPIFQGRVYDSNCLHINGQIYKAAESISRRLSRATKIVSIDTHGRPNHTGSASTASRPPLSRDKTREAYN